MPTRFLDSLQAPSHNALAQNTAILAPVTIMLQYRTPQAMCDHHHKKVEAEDTAPKAHKHYKMPMESSLLLMRHYHVAPRSHRTFSSLLAVSHNLVG